MATRLIYYHPSVLFDPGHAERRDVHALSFFSNVSASMRSGHMLIDRSGTIRAPVRTASIFPLPKLRPFKKSYEDICNERALELLRRADTQAVSLYAFWSGGIDSTLVLVSLLKNASPEQKRNIVVLMTEDSIQENPRFWDEHIRGHLRTDSSAQFGYIFGTPAVITNGDLNDQLFGVGGIERLMSMFGDDIVHKPYRRDTLHSYLETVGKHGIYTDLYLDLYERVMQNAPIPITTHLDYLWWCNFALKWQSTFMRTLSATSARNAHKVTSEYIKARYAPFYNTEEFQLWSMNNLDKRIKDTWRTYKWPAKDIIYGYTKDSVYRETKQKHTSLPHIMAPQQRHMFIDESMQFLKELSPDEYYDPENDFAPPEPRSL